MPLLGKKCPHNVVEPTKVDYFRTDYYCNSCGEMVGWTEDTTQNSEAFITGAPRKLSSKEKKLLR